MRTEGTGSGLRTRGTPSVLGFSPPAFAAAGPSPFHTAGNGIRRDTAGTILSRVGSANGPGPHRTSQNLHFPPWILSNIVPNPFQNAYPTINTWFTSIRPRTKIPGSGKEFPQENPDSRRNRPTGRGGSQNRSPPPMRRAPSPDPGGIGFSGHRYGKNEPGNHFCIDKSLFSCYIQSQYRYRGKERTALIMRKPNPKISYFYYWMFYFTLPPVGGFR